MTLNSDVRRTHNSRESDMLKNVVLFVFLFALVSCSDNSSVSSASNDQCTVKITSPKDNELVHDTNTLNNVGLFSFSIAGSVTNIKGNFVCVYQQIPGGDAWWRSGYAITQDNLGSGNTWSTDIGSCGSKEFPHSVCIVQAVVRSSCPETGQTVSSSSYPYDLAYKCQSEKIRVFTR